MKKLWIMLALLLCVTGVAAEERCTVCGGGSELCVTDECGAVSVLLMPDRSIEVKSINSASESEGAA